MYGFIHLFFDVILGILLIRKVLFFLNFFFASAIGFNITGTKVFIHIDQHYIVFEIKRSIGKVFFFFINIFYLQS